MIGELYVYYFDKSLEKDVLDIVYEINNHHENANYDTNEIKNLMEKYNYKKLEYPYNNSKDKMAIFGLRRTRGKPSINLHFTISDDHFIIEGISQILGIPGVKYDSRENYLQIDKQRETYIMKYILP
jgi:hypothetical protein